MKAVLWALCASLSYVAAFAPLEWSFLAFAVIPALCAAVRDLRGWKLFGLGYATGAIILILGCLWLSETLWVNLLAMTAVEAILFGLAFVALRRLLVDAGWPAVWSAPVVVTTLDFARRHIPLEGFPWLFLGYSQHDWKALIQVADLGGVYGVTFLVALVGGAAYDVITRDRRWVPSAGTGVLVLLASLIYGGTEIANAEHLPEGTPESPTVLAVQANIPQELKQRSQAEVIDRRQMEETRRGVEDGPVDLVIWAETMATLYGVPRSSTDENWPLADDQTVSTTLLRKAEERFVDEVRKNAPDAHLLLGAITREGEGSDHRMFNSALLYGPSGPAIARYDKAFLVPGGEYVPVVGSLPEGWREAIYGWILENAGFVPRLTPGEGLECLPMQFGNRSVRLGVTICYDIAYPSLGRLAVQDGADFLINVSNEAWYPDTAEFAQYTAISVFRAIEARRTLIRCANSGTSAEIDPWGRVRALEKNGRRDGIAGSLRAQPTILSTVSVYVQWGDWIAWGSLIGVVFGLAFGWRNRRGSPQDVTLSEKE